jgi:hypothetical protein
MKNPQMKTRSFNRHPKRSEPYACRIESNTVGSYSVVLSEGGSYRFHIAERVSAGDADEIARFVESSSDSERELILLAVVSAPYRTPHAARVRLPRGPSRELRNLGTTTPLPAWSNRMDAVPSRRC